MASYPLLYNKKDPTRGSFNMV